MAEGIQDARLRELAILAGLERNGSVRVESEKLFRDEALKSMVLHLLTEGYVNGIETMPWTTGEDVTLLGGKPNALARFEIRQWTDVTRVLANQEAFLRISHKGRVRRSELEQALRTGRDREPFGVLWAERHRGPAVTMAVLSAQATSPVTVAYLDMNGLKGINDAHDHHAGDVAIRTYLQTISMLMGDGAEGFRGGSSDEVVVVMRGTTVQDATHRMRAVLQQLRKESVQTDGKEVVPFLTASCGIASTTDAATDAASLVRRADAEQQRAKQASRASPGSSFLVVEGSEPEKV